MTKQTITMSIKELRRLEVIQSLEAKRIRQKQAAEQLSLSVRQVRRLLSNYRSQGAVGLINKRRGKPSNNRINDVERERIITIIQEQYTDFCPTLATEYLARCHGFTHSVETLRQWMIAANIWQIKTKPKKRHYPMRERRPRFGELIQVDGSKHKWFEDRAEYCTLIAFIDDATSALLYARFEPTETTVAYLKGLQSHIQNYGLPVALYSDKHGIFTKHQEENFIPTQLERALEDLLVELILAHSPQAKGRVERIFLTLQDRLVKAMRLEGISDIDTANAFLADYLEQHNQKFALVPKVNEDAHRSWKDSEIILARHCSIQHPRTLDKNLTTRFKGQRFIIQTDPGSPRYMLRKSKITVCEHLNGQIELLYNNESLPYEVFDQPRSRKTVVTEKTLNKIVDKAVRNYASRWSMVRKPAKTHPWKKFRNTQL